MRDIQATSSRSNSETNWILLYIAALCSAAVRGVQKKSYQETHTLISSYFSSFYSLTYASGARRRAFIGSILAGLHHGGISLRALNLLSLVVLGILLAVLTKAVLNVAAELTTKEKLLHVAVLGGVVVSIQWEVLGDLLQIDLLLFVFVSWALCRYVKSSGVRMGAMVFLLLPLALTHEASIFLFPSFVPYVRGKRPTLRELVLPLAFVILLFGASLHWRAAPDSMQVAATKLQTTSPGRSLTPSFSALLAEELHHDLGGSRLIAAFLSRLLRIGSLILACIVVCKSALGSRAQGFVQTFTRALVISLPLWVIAHDWGRFVSDLLFLTYFVEFWLLCALPSTRSAPALDPDGHTDWLTSTPVLVAAIAVLLLGAGFEARVSGMDIRGFLAAAPFLLCALAALLPSKLQPATPQSRERLIQER